MFRPDSNSDRTDYGNILMTPKGYKLESAVGTTYSLDLEALTSVAVCLGLSEEADSRLMQNPICMLNALQKVSNRLILFCEAGQIKVPSKPTALSVLLEKIVVEVALPKDKGVGRYPAFHPKTWMLSYINSEGDRKYRFVVMSRNLTFDRSWDISFAMDSSKKVRQKRKSTPICNFLEYLARNVNKQCIDYLKKRNLIRKMMKEIKDISFSLDSKVFGENFEILPLGIGEKAYKIENDKLFCTQRGNADSTFNELVIMSPFLSRSVITDFNLSDRALSECSRTLITRRSELVKLRECDVNNFTIYTLKDEIIDGEDEISDESSDKRKQDIHAKIYLRRKYADVDLYLGSMNASYSALNKNVEMMVKLGTKNKHLNGESFLDDIFCGNADDTKNPFEQVTIESVIDDTADINRDILEDKIKYLCRTKKIAYISKDDFNMDRYNIKIEFSGIDTDENIMISPINSKRKHILSEHMDFLDMEILQLSEFYKVEIKSGDTVLNRIIMIPTIGFPDNRENIVVNSVIGDKVSFIEYISLVLGDDYILSMIEGKQIRESGIYSKKSGIMPAIYEKMLKVAVTEPEKIKDIGYVLKMVNDSEIIPDEFRTLYETFCSTLKLKIQ
jgi:hypothetical protein